MHHYQHRYGQHHQQYHRPVGDMSLAQHETMELHELLNFKTACAQKIQMMKNDVSDQQLRNLIDHDLQQTQRHIGELQSLLSRATGGVPRG